MSLLGPAGVNARIAQLQARLDAFAPRNVAPTTSGTPGSPAPLGGFQGVLEGTIGGASTQLMNPFANGLNGPIGGMVEEAAKRHGVDPQLFAALVQQESGGNPQAVSHAGAKGLCQLMPGTARDLGVADPFDPAQNLDGGAKYLSQMIAQNGGDVPRALASYNWGATNVQGKSFPQWPQETQNYVKSILARVRNG